MAAACWFNCLVVSASSASALARCAALRCVPLRCVADASLEMPMPLSLFMAVWLAALPLSCAGVAVWLLVAAAASVAPGLVTGLVSTARAGRAAPVSSAAAMARRRLVMEISCCGCLGGKAPRQDNGVSRCFFREPDATGKEKRPDAEAPGRFYAEIALFAGGGLLFTLGGVGLARRIGGRTRAAVGRRRGRGRGARRGGSRSSRGLREGRNGGGDQGGGDGGGENGLHEM